MFCDTHTHSEHSPDAEDSVIDLCEAAVRAGIGVLAITDHANFFEDRTRDADVLIRMQEQKEAVFAAREQFAGKLKLLWACEIGEPQLNPGLAEEVLKNPYDMVVGSNHFLKGDRSIYHREYPPELDDERILEFLQATKDLILFGRFHTLGHLDYILRLVGRKDNKVLSLRKFEPQIEEILTMLIERDMGIEINTSNLKRWLKTLIEPWILERYRMLGGKYITIGSDAHFKEDVGAGVLEAQKLTYDTGFRHVTYFEKGEPVLVSLEGVGK